MSANELVVPVDRKLQRSRTSIFVPPPTPDECEFSIHGKQYRFTRDSCGCFPPESSLRQTFLFLLYWRYWESIILGIVFLNSVALALYDYGDRDNQKVSNKTLYLFNIGFTVLFAIEAIIKIVAEGLVLHKNAYFRSGWNILDFIVVIFGFLDSIPQITSIRGLRLMRVLRPLKIAYTSTAMKNLMTPWLYSLRQMVDVMLFLILLLTLFSIMGLYSFPGDWYFRCRVTPKPINEIWEIDRSITRLCNAYGYGEYNCPASTYCGEPDMYDLPLSHENFSDMGEVYYGTVNFDNFGRSFLASFQVLTFDSWADIMYKAQDSNSVIFARFFFPFLVFIGNFFCLNLIVAVIVESFQTYRSELNEQTNQQNLLKEEEEPPTNRPLQDESKSESPRDKEESNEKLEEENKEDHSDNTKKREIAIELDSVVINIGDVTDNKLVSEENSKNSQKPSSFSFCDNNLSLKHFCRKLSSHPWYKYVIVLLIVGNLLILTFDHHNISKNTQRVIDYLDTMFFLLFWIEMFIEMLATSCRTYLTNSYNITDCVLNIIGLVEVILTYTNYNTKYSVRGVIVVFRTLRAFKLVNKWTALSETLSFLWQSRMDILNFLVLLGLFIFIYAIIGMELFSNEVKFNSNDEKDLEHGTSMRVNFDSIGYALLSAYTLQIGDNWTSFFFPYQRFSFSAYFYFTSAIIILNILLVNLFLAVLLEHFFCDEQKAEMEEEEKRNAVYDAKQRKLRALVSKKSKYQHRVKALLSLLHLYRAVLAGVSLGNSDSRIQLEEKLQGSSLLCFGPENKLRLLLNKIVKHFIFQIAVYVMIILNSVVLTFYTPLNDPNGKLLNFAFIVDVITTSFFCFEIVIKIIVNGLLFNGPGSYLRNFFNILDILATFCMLISLLFSFSILSVQKIFFMFRVLRAIRLIYAYEGFRVRILAMIKGGPQILQTLFISIMFILMFGIIGTHFFKGMFFYCRRNSTDSEYPVITAYDCMNYGGEWISRDISFDNILLACRTLFELITGKSWCNMITFTPDFVDVDYEPQRNANPHNVWYTVSYMIIGYLCIRAVLTGVISNAFFTQHERIQGLHTLTFAQRKWVSLSKIIFKASPVKEYRENSKFYKLYIFLIHPWFQNFILGIVLLNAVILMISFYRAPTELSNFIDGAMYFFLAIYIIEAALKITFYGIDYFFFWWNVFDFLNAIGLFIVTILYIQRGNDNGYMLTFVTFFRVTKLLTLLSKTEILKKIFQIVVLAIPSAATSAMMLLIMMYLFGIVGIFLFSGVKLQSTLDNHANFQNSYTAFLTLFRMSTADGWNDLMHDASRERTQYFSCLDYPSYDDIMANGGDPNGCGVSYAPFYFIFVMIILTFVFLNVFVAIVVSSMMEITKLSESVLSDERLNKFLLSWKKYDPNATGFIEYHLIWNLLCELGEPLGSPAIAMGNRFYAAITLWMLQLSLYRNQENGLHYVTFYDVLESLVKKTIIKPQTLDKITNNESLENLKEGLKELWFQKTQLSMDDEQYRTQIENLRDYYNAKIRKGTNSNFKQITVKLPLLVWIILKISKNLRRRAKERKVYGGKLRSEYEQEQRLLEEQKKSDAVLPEEKEELKIKDSSLQEEEKQSHIPEAELHIEPLVNEKVDDSILSNTDNSTDNNKTHNIPNDSKKTKRKNKLSHNVPISSMSKKTKKEIEKHSGINLSRDRSDNASSSAGMGSGVQLYLYSLVNLR